MTLSAATSGTGTRPTRSEYARTLDEIFGAASLALAQLDGLLKQTTYDVEDDDTPQGYIRGHLVHFLETVEKLADGKAPFEAVRMAFGLLINRYIDEQGDATLERYRIKTNGPAPEAEDPAGQARADSLAIIRILRSQIPVLLPYHPIRSLLEGCFENTDEKEDSVLTVNGSNTPVDLTREYNECVTLYVKRHLEAFDSIFDPLIEKITGCGPYTAEEEHAILFGLSLPDKIPQPFVPG